MTHGVCAESGPDCNILAHPSHVLVLDDVGSNNVCGQDPEKQVNRVLDFVGLPANWDLGRYVDDVKGFKAGREIMDPDRAAIKQMIGEALEEPLRDFYR